MSARLARIIARHAKRTPPRLIDAIDAQAEREGDAMEYMAGVIGKGVPLLPHVAKSLEISAAMDRHLAQPSLFANPLADPPARNRGHFQKQVCMRIVERALAGGAGQKEIVTRQDLARRAVQAAARRLDVLSSRNRHTDKVERDAMKIASLLLRGGTPHHAMSR